MKPKEQELLEKHSGEIGRALEILFASEYVDHKKLYVHNFFRGIFFSAGGVIGATLVIGLLIWILSIFDNIPVIGPIFDNLRENIDQSGMIRK